MNETYLLQHSTYCIPIPHIIAVLSEEENRRVDNLVGLHGALSLAVGLAEQESLEADT